MSIHDGHRLRLKERFHKEGLENFQPNQVLELLLFYCIPRQDTNPIAHRLLLRFGALEDVLKAPISELMRVEGIGENAATFLSLLTEVNRYCHIHKKEDASFMNSVEEYGNFLFRCLRSRRNETVYLLCLDAKCKLISCEMVGEGSVNSAAVPIRRVVEMALSKNATTVVLGHNHPSGFAVPSEEDIRTTYRLAAALNTVEICLADHIVVADDEYISMVQSRCYDPRENILPY